MIQSLIALILVAMSSSPAGRPFLLMCIVFVHEPLALVFTNSRSPSHALQGAIEYNGFTFPDVDLTIIDLAIGDSEDDCKASSPYCTIETNPNNPDNAGFVYTEAGSDTKKFRICGPTDRVSVPSKKMGRYFAGDMEPPPSSRSGLVARQQTPPHFLFPFFFPFFFL